MIIHLVYFAALIEAYRTGDLGQVYPIARGSAPLMTATATTLFVGENLSLIGWAGIVRWSPACSCCRRAVAASSPGSTAAPSASRS